MSASFFDSALGGIVIGALLSTISNVVTHIFTLRNSDLQRRHELRLKRVELYEAVRIAALQEYCAALGDMVKYDYSPAKSTAQLTESRARLSRALHSVAPHVSGKTLHAMLAVQNPIGLSPDSPELLRLNSRLRSEFAAVPAPFSRPRSSRAAAPATSPWRARP